MRNSEIKDRFTSPDKIAALGAAAVVMMFLLATVDIYAPLTEGWWHVYARWLDAGEVPYRDFKLLITPGMPLITWAMTSILGESFLGLRLFGVLVAGGIAFILSIMLSKVLNPIISMSLTSFGVVFLYSGSASIVYDYNYFAVLFLLVSALFLQKGLSQESDESIAFKWMHYFYSGIFTGLVFLVKQSTGIASIALFSLSILFLFFFCYRCELSRLRGLFYYSIGWFTPLAMFSAFFLALGSFEQMLSQVFGGATDAKGSLNSILFSWLDGLYNPMGFGVEIYWAVSTVLGIYFLVLFVQFWLKLAKVEIDHLVSRIPTVVIVALAVIGSLIVALVLRLEMLSDGNFRLGETSYRYWLELSTHLYVAPLITCVVGLFWSVFSSDRLKWTPLFATSLVLAWSTGMSAGLTEYGIFMSSVVSIAWGLSALGSLAGALAITIPLAIITILGLTFHKFEVPYSWWGYEVVSANKATEVSQEGLTKGLRFEPSQLAFFNQSLDFLRPISACKNGIEVYPHLPIFQLELDALPKSKASVYWFDFYPKDAVKDQSQRIISNPPSGVVLVNLPDFVNDGHGILFNSGDTPEQVMIGDALKNVINRNDYEAGPSDLVSSNYLVEVYRNSCYK